MDFLPLILYALLTLAGISLWLKRRARSDSMQATAERVRRGTGHALLGLQQFIEPSVEHIFEVENREEKDEDDHDGENYDPEAIRSDLAACLAWPQIDPEEVRRHLTAAVRAGLDWNRVYEGAVQDELHARPFRAPSIPPSWRVAPRE